MFKKRKSIRLNNRKFMYSMLAFVLVGIATMTIAYATLSTTLRITGSAEFQNATWELTLEEFPDFGWAGQNDYGVVNGNVVTYGTAKSLQKPTIVGTNLENFKVSLVSIGDGVEYEYKITNNGEIPARLESVIWDDFIVESDNPENVDLINEYFNSSFGLYELFYTDEGVSYYGHEMVEDAILCPGASFEVYLWVGISEHAPRVPYEKTTISNLSAEFNFVAADQNLCDGDTPVTPNYVEK